MHKIGIVAAVLVLVVAVAGLWWIRSAGDGYGPPCQSIASGDAVACSTVDGFPVGQFRSECTAQSDSCAGTEATATAGLETAYPRHSPIARVRLYGLDAGHACKASGEVLCAWSGGYTIFVFDLADGTRHALGVACPGITGCVTMPRWNSPSS